MGTPESDLGLSPVLSLHASLTKVEGGNRSERVRADRDGEEGISTERLQDTERGSKSMVERVRASGWSNWVAGGTIY